MHYYKRNLGDYAKKAGRLTMLQHGAYTLLIDACYDREVFPTLDQAIEWTWASTDQEIEAVKFVLARFFNLTEDGQYVQDRILQELLEYHAKADKNKQIAIDRETKRKENSTKRAQVVNETPPNHKPITNNHNKLVGEICIAIKNEGILDINPSNPTFLTLIDAGASVEEFTNAAKISKERGKNFAYTIAVVKGQREDAKNIDIHKGAFPKKETFGWRNDDTMVLKKAAELGVYTSGKSRFEILAAIDRKEGKA